MRKLLASLGVIALAGCEVPPPPQPAPRPTPPHGSVSAITVVDTQNSPVVTIAGFTWRYDSALARGTFTLTNNGPKPVDRMLIVCDVYDAPAKTVVGRLVANIQEPLPAGSTRTFTNVSLNGSAVAPEQTVECHRIASALRS
jgi:hypothetical protein